MADCDDFERREVQIRLLALVAVVHEHQQACDDSCYITHGSRLLHLFDLGGRHMAEQIETSFSWVVCVEKGEELHRFERHWLDVFLLFEKRWVLVGLGQRWVESEASHHSEMAVG